MNKVNSVSFKNFRGLDNLTVPLSQVTMLTGANGSGKTSVLEGLYCLFSETRLDVSWLSRYERTRDDYNYKLFWDECPSYGHTECGVTASINNQTWEWTYKRATLSDLDRDLIDSSYMPLDSFAKFALWTWGDTTRVQLLSDDGKFYIFPNKSMPLKSICRYIDFASAKHTTNFLSFELSQQLTEALKILNPQVTDVRIASITNGLSVVLNNNKEVTLDTLGNGATTWVSMLLHIFSINPKVKDIPIIFLIDEMGTGIHYSMMYGIWQYIKAFAKQNPHIQFVFTSHSDDCIMAYCKVFADEDASVIGLYRTFKGKMVATEFAATDSFQNIINDNLEVRG